MKADEKNAVLEQLREYVREFSEKNGIEVFMISAINEKLPSGDIDQRSSACINGTPRYIASGLAQFIREDPKVGLILSAALAEAGCGIVGIGLCCKPSDNSEN